MQAAGAGGIAVGAGQVVAGVAAAGAGAGLGLTMARGSMPEVFDRVFRAQGLHLERLTFRCVRPSTQIIIKLRSECSETRMYAVCRTTLFRTHGTSTIIYGMPILDAPYAELYAQKVVVLPDDHDYALPGQRDVFIEGPMIHEIGQQSEMGEWIIERGTIS